MFLAVSGDAVASTGFRVAATLEPPGGFPTPSGVGVNNTSGLFAGDVYASSFSSQIHRFSPSGSWEKDAALPEEALAAGVAVDNAPLSATEGDVYVGAPREGKVIRYSAELALEQTINVGIEGEFLALDSSGHLFVASESAVLEFTSTGEPINASGAPSAENAVVTGGPQIFGIATDIAGDLLVATAEGTYIYSLSGGVYTRAEQPIESAPARGVAVDSEDHVLIDAEGQRIGLYALDGTELGAGGQGVLQGARALAAGPNGDVEVVNQFAPFGARVVYQFESGESPATPTTEPPQATGPTSLILNGTLGGGGTSGYYFDYNKGESCEGGSRTTETPGSSGHVQTEVTGLDGSQLYTFCLVATGFGTAVGGSVSSTTESVAPVATETAFRRVKGTAATITAQVNPENLSGSYVVEYAAAPLASASGKQTTPATAYTPGRTVSASVVLEGLKPATEYHFRLVATNNHGQAGSGVESTFRTLTAPEGLPDGRAWEMVTPPENSGADVYYPHALKESSLSEGIHTELSFQVAEDGNAVAYVSDPTTGGTGKGGKGLGNEYVARRGSGGGWTQSNVQPAGRLITYYRGFSPQDLAVGVLSQAYNQGAASEIKAPLSLGAPTPEYPGLYSCDLHAGPCSTPEEALGDPYRPLYRTPLNRTEQEFGTSEFGQPIYIAQDANSFGPVFVGGSADFSRLLFVANDALPGVEGPLGTELVESVRTEMEKGENSDYLYETGPAGLNVVDVLPDGHVAGNATFGSSSDFTRVISGDGSRVFWTDLTTGVLYARVENTSTVQISAGTSPAHYWTASADGRYVFYSEGESGGALYRFDLQGAAGSPRVALTPSNAEVSGVIGATEDGRDVYFVAKGVLSSRANRYGASAQEGQPNLYLSKEGAPPLFVTTLSAKDGGEVEPFYLSGTTRMPAGDWFEAAGRRTAEVAAGGGLVFMSDRRLASAGYPQGYDNRGFEEVYTYDPAANQLFCVSCSTSGEPAPSAVSEAAAFLPVSWALTEMPQWISDDGNRVFFDSAVPLVAQDTDGVIDPYEWEREGTGSCTVAGAVNGGCIYLLSSGSSESATWLIGASANGDDAFVVSRSQLSAEDHNEVFDLYDARVGGVRPPAPPACTGTGCQGVPALAPTFMTSPSETASGLANFEVAPSAGGPKPKKTTPTNKQKLANALAACRKLTRHKRKQCEASARRRYGTTRKAGSRARNRKGGR